MLAKGWIRITLQCCMIVNVNNLSQLWPIFISSISLYHGKNEFLLQTWIEINTIFDSRPWSWTFWNIYLFIYLNIQFTKMINLHATIQPISSYENGSWSQENSTGALNRFMHNILVSVYVSITLSFNPILTKRFTDAIVASFNRLAICCVF